MWMILILIFLLMGISLIIFSFYFTPPVEKKVDDWRKKKTEDLERELKDVFLERGVPWIMRLYLILPLLLAGIGYFFLRNYLGAVVGAGLGFIIPSFLTKIRKERIRETFDQQIIDTVNCISNSLRGGLSILQALETVVEDIPSPTRDQFGWIVKENRMGIALDESLASLNQRMKLKNLELVINSILVAKETGGNLPKVLSRVVNTIRDNRKIKAKMKVLTLQGKMQGVIMSILPIAFALFVKSTNPHHFDIMFHTDLGKILLGVAVGLQIIGMFFIVKLSKI